MLSRVLVVGWVIHVHHYSPHQRFQRLYERQLERSDICLSIFVSPVHPISESTFADSQPETFPS